MPGSRSELQQAVAPLFSTPRAERQVLAVPVLRAVRGLLVRGWCEGAMARDVGGHPVTLTCDARVAVRWSLYGAPRFLRRFDMLHVQYALAELRRAAHPRSLEEANNFGNQREAIAVVDKALTACGYSRRGGWATTNTPQERMPVVVRSARERGEHRRPSASDAPAAAEAA